MSVMYQTGFSIGVVDVGYLGISSFASTKRKQLRPPRKKPSLPRWASITLEKIFYGADLFYAFNTFHFWILSVLPPQRPIEQIQGLLVGETNPYRPAVIVACLAQLDLLAVLWQLPRPSYVLIDAVAYNI